MKILYSDQQHTNTIYNSIFLAGPSPRADKDPDINWRLPAVELFQTYENNLRSSIDFDELTLFIPLPSSGVVADYDAQIEWEQKYLRKAKVILFWVPRDLVRLPAFTTNVEFGQYVETPKIVYGRPDAAPKNNYLDKLFRMNQPEGEIQNTLEGTVKASITKLFDLK